MLGAFRLTAQCGQKKLAGEHWERAEATGACNLPWTAQGRFPVTAKIG
jgi:hypothetical protein